MLAMCHGSAVPKLGALIFQAAADTMQLSPTIDSVKSYVSHVVVCQPVHATREMEGYMSEWSRHTHIPSAVYKGTRNACLRAYSNLVPPTVVSVVLVEWNMRLYVNGSIPMSSWHHEQSTGIDNGAEYAVAPDQSGLVLDWTPLVMRVGARCGYLGRFICVDSDVAHRHLMAVDYELDVDKETRQVIERDMISIYKYPPPVLANVFITRQPLKGKENAMPEPPADPEFAYAWYWMGRECEKTFAEMDAARMAFTRRLDLSDDAGDRWYATYRLGDMAVDPLQSVNLLLEAYNLQPRRREPLAALIRRYADEGKYALCQLFGSIALAIPFPAGPEIGPHIEVPIYEWMVADEYSVCLARLGHLREAADLAQRLLAASAITTMPEEHRQRIEENIAVWKPPVAKVSA
jgi:hypothetical protein